MSSRVNRIARARAALQPEEAAGKAATYGEPEEPEEAYQIDPVLKVFTELPPEFNFKLLKDARADLERVVSKHKEVLGDEDAP